MITERYSKEQLILQKLLKKLRNDRSLTQSDLAEKLNIPQSLVSKYESGERHLTYIEMIIICTALDISISKFSILFEEHINKNES